MRSLLRQFGLALAVLIAWPLLGGGAHAWASFILTPPPGWSDSHSEGSDAPVPDGQTDPNSGEHPSPNDPGRYVGDHPLWWTGLGQSGGCGSTSLVSTSGGSIPPAFAGAAQVSLAPLQAAEWLYLGDAQDRPPPFPSRLFRPPRA